MVFDSGLACSLAADEAVIIHVLVEMDASKSDNIPRSVTACSTWRGLSIVAVGELWSKYISCKGSHFNIRQNTYDPVRDGLRSHTLVELVAEFCSAPD